METSQTAMAAGANPPNLETQVLDLFSSGVTLGDMFHFSENDYEAVYALAHSLYSQGRFDDAMRLFAFLTASSPYEKRFANALASSMQMLKMYKQAIEYYSVASVMDLTDPMPTFHTAECLMALSHYPEARQALELVQRQSQTPERAALLARATALLEHMSEKKLGAGERPLIDLAALDQEQAKSPT